MSHIPFDDALELLSNQYRRDILKLITVRERYAFELSKLLNISQRAVSNHLKSLQDAGIIISEKRKSRKGPDREYFQLDRAVVLSLTVAPNLYLATLRPLGDTPETQLSITPELQLSKAKDTGVRGVIAEGLELLPQIKEGLELLEVQQSKLLRGYQGLRNHIREILDKHKFNTKQIRIILLLIENDGEVTKEALELALGESSESFIDDLNTLKQNEILTTQFVDTGGAMSFTIQLKV